MNKNQVHIQIFGGKKMEGNQVHIQIFGGKKMEGNQKIHCTVGTCKYNETNQNLCKLQAIQVEPTKNCNTKQPEESMCSSYIYGKE